MLNIKTKKGAIADYSIWIILGLLVLVVSLLFIFKSDIVGWVRGLPSYQYPEVDTQIDLTKLKDLFGDKMEILATIGLQGEKTASKEGYIFTYKDKKKTKFYVRAEQKDEEVNGKIYLTRGEGILDWVIWDKNVAIIKNSFIIVTQSVLKSSEKNSDLDFIKSLDGSKIWSAGNAIIKEKKQANE
jgi:hypothetical protein